MHPPFLTPPPIRSQTRPDIFATTEEELQGVLTDAIESKKTTGAGRAVAWDGFSKGKAAADQQREAEEQKREGAVKAFPRVHNPAAPEQGAAERPEEQASKRQKTGGE